MIPFYFLFARDVITVGTSANALAGSGTITGMGHLWFIPYIICCYVVTPLLYTIAEKMVKNNKQVYGLGVLSICGVVFLYSHFYHCYFNAAWITCYVLGYFMAKAKPVYSIEESTYLRMVTPIFLLSNLTKIYVEYVRPFSGVFDRMYTIVVPYCTWH